VTRVTRRRPSLEITALARIEGRRLLAHPFFVIGVLLSIAMVYAYWSIGLDPRLTGMLLSGYALLPLAAATAIAANLGALRSRRDNTDELYASLPRRRSTRAAGQLLGLAYTLPVCVVLLACTYLAVRVQNPSLHLPLARHLLPLRQPPWWSSRKDRSS
jgi:disulfide bond formation protein DsbB